MQTTKLIISVSDQRLARWLIWAALWLRRAQWLRGLDDIWATAAEWAEPLLRHKLRWTRQLILQIIFLRALNHSRSRTPGARQPRAAQRFGAKPASLPGSLRAAVGSRLRRLLRGRTALERIDAMIRLLTNIETEIARMARRLTGGIRRKRRVRHAPHACALLASVSGLALTVACDGLWWFYGEPYREDTS